MSKKDTDFMKELLEIDETATDGIYCAELDEDDLKAFAEHARKRRAEKENK